MRKLVRLSAFVRIKDGEIVCMCLRRCKGCDKDCEEDVVYYDRYRGWKKAFNQDKYGQSHFDNF